MDGTLAMVLKRDRLAVGAALGVIAVLAWGYILWLARGPGMAMPDMDGMADMPAMDMSGMAMMAPAFTPWTAGHAAFMFSMWAVMMIGMMTPTVAPVILIYARVARQAEAGGTPFVAAGWFAAGYLLCWSLFAALATGAQYGLERLALLSPPMVSSSRYFGAGVLFAAGLYQFTPFKEACLAGCRAPLSFIQRRGGFRPGIGASLRLGLLHGLYCVGCCWALMALLFVGGVMNILWIAAIMIYVLAEKLIPRGRVVSMLAGLAAIGAGFWTLLH